MTSFAWVARSWWAPDGIRVDSWRVPLDPEAELPDIPDIAPEDIAPGLRGVFAQVADDRAEAEAAARRCAEQYRDTREAS
jgi:hypothetical protein